MKVGKRNSSRLSILPALLLAVSLLPAARASAGVRLPAVFSSHMVIQRDKPVVVWGWATAGETVTAQVNAATTTAVANDKGEWRLSLPAMQSGGPAVTLTVSASNKIVLEDVLVGEVWLCSGQSNMEFGIGNAVNGQAEIAAANEPDIRLMKVDKSWKPSPADDLTGTWKVCTPTTVAEGGWNGFSAVGYFFGRELHHKLGVPVGLIDATWGGTRIESWTPPQGFAMVPALGKENAKLRASMPGDPEHDRRMAEAVSRVEQWTAAAKKLLDAGKLPPPMPTVPAALLGPDNVQAATALFNGMIHPICPFGIRGAIWYQGESNHDEGMLYAERMKALVGGWRSIWGEGDFPFYYVQIAPNNYGDKQPFVPEFWEAQAAAESIPNTGMAVVNDIGTLNDIHPKNKQDVGHRLASRALEDTYGMHDVLGHSPTFKSLATEGPKLRVTFDHVGTGLSSRDGKPLTWFEIADADSHGYHKATATIDGASVLLSAPDVKAPTSVRFAWGMLAEPNLMNSAGFPASAFRAGPNPAPDLTGKQVPELKDYTLVYDLDLNRLEKQIFYSTDDHAMFTRPFDRIAYGMELEDARGTQQWVYVSMDAFTSDPELIGVPSLLSGAAFQQNVAHLNVASNVNGIVTGTDLAGGNIEFWPNNYAPGNAAGVAGASSDVFDFGDQKSDLLDGYGSMQIHNHDAKQTLLAVNHWRDGQGADIGIGNATVGSPDWSFAANAGRYVSKRLRVYVRLK